MARKQVKKEPVIHEEKTSEEQLDGDDLFEGLQSTAID